MWCHHASDLPVVSALGPTVIALSYGVAPAVSLSYFLGLTIDSMNATHIFRVVMGLCLALAILWVVGALRSTVRRAALYSLVVFMCDIRPAGRTLS